MISDDQLDKILALQLTVAWAGEGACEPSRLGWWRTDLIDPAGGGDLLARLLPKTHAWASLEAVREAARRTDAAARARMANPDKLRTLFFFGFAIDERLDERLRALKQLGTPPGEALPISFAPDSPFSPDQLPKQLDLGGATGAHTVVPPTGRQVKGPVPEDPLQLAQSLAAALVPFSDTYPMPFYAVK